VSGETTGRGGRDGSGTEGEAQRADGIDRRIEESLSALGAGPSEPPPMGEALSRAIGDLEPVGMRFPRRESAAVLVLSLVYATGILAWLGVRDDVHRLPRPWLVGLGGLWLAAFVAITWLLLVPPRAQVMPRWRLAAGLSIAAAVIFMAAGLMRPAALTAVGVSYPLTFEAWFDHGERCVRWGLLVALLPGVLTALAVRGALPVGSRWAAAAIGAAGGALGGLVLHIHCPIDERLHIGLAHGGLVVVAAALAALAARIGERAWRAGDVR